MTRRCGLAWKNDRRRSRITGAAFSFSHRNPYRTEAGHAGSAIAAMIAACSSAASGWCRAVKNVVSAS
jgi:hypothetical protein